MSKRPRGFFLRTSSLTAWLVLLVAVWLAVLLFALLRGPSRLPVANAAIVVVHTHPFFAPDGRECRIQVGEDDHQAARVIVVQHLTTPDPSLADTTADTRPGTGPMDTRLRSRVTLVSLYPPNAQRSGLWIDGIKRSLVTPLTVVYVSDKLPATEIVIAPTQQPRIIEDARWLDGFSFIAKWISPRLPPPTTSPSGKD